MRGRGEFVRARNRKFEASFGRLKPGLQTRNSIDSIGRNHIVQEYVITLARQPAVDLSQHNL